MFKFKKMNSFKTIFSLVLVVFLAQAMCLPSFAIGSDSSLQMQILQKYKKLSIQEQSKNKSLCYSLADTETNVLNPRDISKFSIKRVTYFDENGNVTKAYEGNAALRHLVAMEKEKHLNKDQEKSMVKKRSSSIYSTRLVETEDNNVTTKHKKKFSSGTSFESIANSVINLGINVSSAYWNKYVTWLYAAMTFGGECIEPEQVLSSKGPTFEITQNAYVESRIYEVANTWQDMNDYDEAYISKKTVSSYGVDFYAKTKTTDLHTHGYVEDYTTETGKYFYNKSKCKELAVQYYENSDGILPRYDSIKTTIKKSALNKIEGSIDDDGLSYLLD